MSVLQKVFLPSLSMDALTPLKVPKLLIDRTACTIARNVVVPDFGCGGALGPNNGKDRYINQYGKDSYSIEDPDATIVYRSPLKLQDKHNDGQLATGNRDDSKCSEDPLVKLVLHDLVAVQGAKGLSETPMHREDQEGLSKNRQGLSLLIRAA
jgi:hypothetical protein